MGYAFPGQTGRGIHTRLFSRAFVIEDHSGERVVYVSMDLCMSMYSMKMGVIALLEKMGYGSVYRHDNVLMSGIHTHSGPGAYSWFLLYDISMAGFDKKVRFCCFLLHAFFFLKMRVCVCVHLCVC